MPELVLDEDLEDYWRDLRPSLYKGTISSLLKQGPACLSIAMRLGMESHNELVSVLHEAKLPAFEFTALEAMREQLLRLFPPDFMKTLLRNTRAQSRVKCQTLGRQVPLARHLATIHDTDIGPLGAFEEEFVIKTFWGWITGFEYGGCGAEELDLLQLTEEQMGLDVEETIRRPRIIQTRLLHLLLLGGVYGVFEHTDRMALMILNLETLVQTKLLTSDQRQAHARQINTLLEELEHWNRHFSSFITVVLGWSGGAEDAVLLRGLCEPLMQKIEASKCRLS